MHRRHVLLSAGALTLAFTSLAQANQAANAAEDFVATNIQAGFDILNDRAVGASARQQRFADLLLGLTDVRRVALFLLGRYAADASAADLDAYVAAYQDYALSIYRTYFQLYAGQSLKVVSSRERAPGDFIVTTNMAGGAPMEIDFRVRTDGAKPMLVDVAVSGVWLALAQRDQFLATLAVNKGDIKALTAQLRALPSR
ncbi:MAG TPA: ABC transporter substrate-binding protein [Rhizomicrobium sp.]|nr:ABC transporter substrate-binding protein [Rhizomicrobium sp.]